MRTMTLALLLASATSGSAFAQARGSDGMDAGEPGPRREWTERRNVQERAPQADQRREGREQRQTEAEPDRAPRGRWGGAVTTPPVPPVPQAQPSGGWAGNRVWRGRGDVLTTNPPVQTPSTDRRWQGRGDDDSRNDGRRWDRDRNERWGRDRDERHAENRDGAWHREENGRWERRGGDDRYDRDGRNRYENRDWNRSWRYDRRYDWQHYRNQFRDRYRAPRYYNPYGYRHGYQRFGIGIYLDSLYFGSRYWLSDPWEYRLPPAPYGCRWVRYYDDVLLVETRSGYVVDVIYDFFW
ncbi:RcnB family protein [Aquisediminimonas profunda]|uniref:RcnB family protein n=1 Tax=Aquisediminimonas profunda TaxID=1550733 RepID=UPI001C631CDA|nr:RcnB family protein [Aquisediminimonas profunda]